MLFKLFIKLHIIVSLTLFSLSIWRENLRKTLTRD